MKIIIAGSSGFVGTHLSDHFKKQGDELVLLSRSGKEGTRYWSPEAKQVDPSILEGADVVINLCGESVLGRWSAKKLEKIRESRFVSTQFLCDTLMHLSSPPKLYIGSSALGYYGDRGEEVLTESSHSGHGYLAEICRHWEEIANALTTKGIRVVFARFGIIFGEGGGALPKMLPAFRMGFGGKLGSGKQIVSWIGVEDVVAGIDHVIHHEEVIGPVNFTTPHAVSNIELTKTLGQLLKRPTMLSVPRWALSLMYGSGGAEMFLYSTHVQPEVLLKSGYHFILPDLEPTLKKYLPLIS